MSSTEQIFPLPGIVQASSAEDYLSSLLQQNDPPVVEPCSIDGLSRDLGSLSSAATALALALNRKTPSNISLQDIATLMEQAARALRASASSQPEAPTDDAFDITSYVLSAAWPADEGQC